MKAHVHPAQKPLRASYMANPALAACQDSAFRMVANLLQIEITNLEVRVTATADVRGSMAMDPKERYY